MYKEVNLRGISGPRAALLWEASGPRVVRVALIARRLAEIWMACGLDRWDGAQILIGNGSVHFLYKLHLVAF
jgi:hypothetical protein